MALTNVFAVQAVDWFWEHVARFGDGACEDINQSANVFAFESFGDVLHHLFCFVVIVQEVSLCLAVFRAFLSFIVHRGCDIGPKGLVCVDWLMRWWPLNRVIPEHHDWV